MKLLHSALITQSNYIPWKGYFDAIQIVENFVVYDDMQFTRRDWRNRNVIKTPSGPKWMTIPVEVKGKYNQKIKDTRIADAKWSLSHWDILKQNYKSAACFLEMAEWIEPLYKNCNYDYLTDVNTYFIQGITDFLGIKTKIRFSSDFNLHDDKTQRLLDICLNLHATDYCTGPTAKSYLDTQKFVDNGIKVHFLDYSDYPEYPQLYPPFDHSVTILDLIFTMGLESRKFMKFIA